MILYLPVAIVTVLLPSVSARVSRGHSARSLLTNSLLATGAVCLVFTVFYTVFPHLIVRIAFGAKYQGAASLLWMFAIAMSLDSLLNVVLVYRLGHHETRTAWLLLGGAAGQAILFVLFSSSPRELLTGASWSRQPPRSDHPASAASPRTARRARTVSRLSSRQAEAHPVPRRARRSISLAAGTWYHAILIHPNSRLPCCVGDGTSTVRDYMIAAQEHKNILTFTHDPFNGAPEGIPRAPWRSWRTPASRPRFMLLFNGLLGLVVAFNLFSLVGLIGTAIAVFWPLRSLGGTTIASLFGGHVVGFRPDAIARSQSAIRVHRKLGIRSRRLRYDRVREHRSDASAAFSASRSRSASTSPPTRDFWWLLIAVFSFSSICVVLLDERTMCDHWLFSLRADCQRDRPGPLGAAYDETV